MRSRYRTKRRHHVYTDFIDTLRFRLGRACPTRQLPTLLEDLHACVNGADNDQHHQRKNSYRLYPLTLFRWHPMQHRLEINKSSASHRSRPGQHAAKCTDGPKYVERSGVFNGCAGEKKRYTKSHALRKLKESLHEDIEGLCFDVFYPSQTPFRPSLTKAIGRYTLTFNTHEPLRIRVAANSKTSHSYSSNSRRSAGSYSISDLPLAALDVLRRALVSIVRGHLARRAFTRVEVRR